MTVLDDIQSAIGGTLEHRICSCGNKSFGDHKHWCEWLAWGKTVADALERSVLDAKEKS